MQHSYLSRFYNLLMFAITSLFVLGLITNVFPFITNNTVSHDVDLSFGAIKYKDLKNGDRMYYLPTNISLNADFSKIWNVNTKKIFLYIQLEFEENNERTVISLQDFVLTSKNNAVVYLINQEVKYDVIDYKLPYDGVEIKLKYDLMPHIGFIKTFELETRKVEVFPE
eukprot:TRINITY_DN9500_c0_g1_i1.p1 TRINITY_DN9500_c0_g1~~TRINITY_DN9500_c0_g1_i1.p1  ORF type:complete len:168 (+),score=35.25 TRINITY_DN9500_c0_g1_i1:84-587(+)